MKYAFVRANREEFRLGRMCEVLQVSRSGYYDWAVRQSLDYQAPMKYQSVKLSPN